MPWNGTGTYSLPPAYSPEVNGTVIDAARYNGLTSDVAAGITAALAKNGENTPTANLPMGSFKHTGAADANAAGQYMTFGNATGRLGNLDITANTLPNNGLYLPSANTLGFATNGTAAGSISSAQRWTFPGSTGSDNLILYATSSNSGFRNRIAVDNTSNTASSGAEYFLGVAGTSAGDPKLYFNVLATTDWTMGLDNSDSDAFVLSLSSSLGTNNRWRVSTGGNHSIPTPTSGVALTVNGFLGSAFVDVVGDGSAEYMLWLRSTGGATTGRVAQYFERIGGTGKAWAIGNDTDGGTDNSFDIRDVTRAVIPFSLSSAGNFTLAAPSSGSTLQVIGGTAAAVVQIQDATVALQLIPNGASGFILRTAAAHDLIFGTNATSRLTLTSDGRLYGTALHNNVGGLTGTTNQYIASGDSLSLWSPTLTNTTNITSSGSFSGGFARIGNLVVAGFAVQIDPTSASTLTELQITTPIASNLSGTNMWGTVNRSTSGGAAPLAGVVAGDSATDRIVVSFINDTDTANRTWIGTVVYIINT